MRRTATVTALALGLFLAGCGDDGNDVGAPTSTAAPTTEQTAPDTSEAPGGDVDGDEAEAVVGDWIDALADGDLDEAWALTHPNSQEAFGGRTAFDEAASGFAEGYGAWAAVEGREESWVDLAPEVPDAGVVVLQGTLEQEGTTTPAAAEAVPVRRDGDALLVDPFHQLVDPSAVSLEPMEGTTVEVGALVLVTAPGGSDLLLAVGDELVPTTPGSGPEGAVLVETDLADVDPGPVPVTLVVVGADGNLQAESFGLLVTG